MNPYVYELLANNTSKIRGLFTKKSQKYLFSLVLAIVVVYNVFFPQSITSAERDHSMFNVLIPDITRLDAINYKKDFPNKFPISERVAARYSTYVTATAYNSEPGQTDDTPCLTANGFNVCEHGHENIIATNNLPLGTRVRFPDIYGDKIFYVMDRMNPRYTQRVDFWMISKNDAKQFGKKYVKMEVL